MAKAKAKATAKTKAKAKAKAKTTTKRGAKARAKTGSGAKAKVGAGRKALKVIVLGGAGDMGSRAVEDLVRTSGVASVTIADRDRRGAERLADALQGQRARVVAVGVDATDHGALVQAIAGHDVAASALGPFHRFEAALVRASLEAGADYVSVCDEWEAAQAVIAESDGPARQQGRTVVTGLGASPGLTNVAVRHLADRLDRVRGADISCFQPLDAGGGEAVHKHMLFIMSGAAAAWRGGRQVMLRACSEERTVEFPQFGALPLWNMGHSEPYTIPRFMPGIEEVNFFMGYGPGAELFVRPAQWGWFSSPRRVDRFARLMGWADRLSGRRDPGLGALRIDVWGERDGAPAHEMICGVGQMRDTTGLSLSVGALMVGRGELLTDVGGVYAPEAAIRPAPFIEALMAKGLDAYEDVAMTRRLTLQPGATRPHDPPVHAHADEHEARARPTP